jgi:hypothetical protein
MMRSVIQRCADFERAACRSAIPQMDWINLKRKRDQWLDFDCHCPVKQSEMAVCGVHASFFNLGKLRGMRLLACSRHAEAE